MVKLESGFLTLIAFLVPSLRIQNEWDYVCPIWDVFPLSDHALFRLLFSSYHCTLEFLLREIKAGPFCVCFFFILIVLWQDGSQLSFLIAQSCMQQWLLFHINVTMYKFRCKNHNVGGCYSAINFYVTYLI